MVRTTATVTEADALGALRAIVARQERVIASGWCLCCHRMPAVGGINCRGCEAAYARDSRGPAR